MGRRTGKVARSLTQSSQREHHRSVNGSPFVPGDIVQIIVECVPGQDRHSLPDSVPATQTKRSAAIVLCEGFKH